MNRECTGTLAALRCLALAAWCCALPAHAQVSVRQVAAGWASACELTGAGAVRCWGENVFGELGDGSNRSRNAPLDVAGLTSGVAAIAMSWYRACAVTTSGALKCWGNNDHGGLGNNTTLGANMPADVVGLSSGVAAVSVGKDHTCALTTDGTLKCWGANAAGQLGDGTTADRLTPVDVMTDVAAVSLGTIHTCALTRAGSLKCWGDNTFGQLGDGTLAQRARPADVPGLASGVASFSAGDDQTCAVQLAALLCWGANGYTRGANDLAIATVVSHPDPVAGFQAPVSSVSVGWAQTCAVMVNGGAKCWRLDEFYQLGTVATGTYQGAPTDVVGLGSGVAAISAGATFTCALLTSGPLQCWGSNDAGQIGDSTNITRMTPTEVSFPQVSYQGLWWNSPAGSESGWGVMLAHQEDVLFATWFTYDTDGSPMWLVMSYGEKSGPATYSGALYRTTGPAYSAPFRQVGVVTVGDATFTFADKDNGTFRYTVNGVTQTKSIMREVFVANSLPNCMTGGPTDSPTVQDLWWNSPANTESGWGLQLAQQGATVFAAWFTYDTDGKALWLVVPDAAQTATKPLTFSGSVFRTTGPAFSAVPWNPGAVTVSPVGNAVFTFTSNTTGTMGMTINGVSVFKTITREVFRVPTTSCFY